VTDASLVRIPAALVKAALVAAPERITVVGRDPKHRVTLQKDTIFFGTGSDCPFVSDPYTGERRRFTYRDIYHAAKISDALPNIDFHMSLGLTSDVPMATYDRHQFLAMLEGCTKPLVITAADRQGLADQYEMACTLLGGEEAFRLNPLFIVYVEPSSPLVHSKEAVQKLLFAADHGIPVIYTPCPMCGGTAPVTLAGVLVQTLAECLTGLVIAQLKRRGASVVIGGVESIMDMNTTVMSYGAPEFDLLSAAFTDIAKSLRLPMFSTAGCSDAKTMDQQAAIEAAMSLLMSAQSGANLIHDAGYLESGLLGSYDMLVMVDEIIGMVKRIMRGLNTDEAHQALEVIDRVGPGGQYLSDAHTYRHFKTEFWFPALLNRDRREVWESKGSEDLATRVRRKVHRLIETYNPTPMDAEMRAKLKRLVDLSDQTYAGNEVVRLVR
jgi:trimethylamine---corrinoid protein Co-methyltransferase